MTAARRRWPLLLIGASAGTATWSGWVGLGSYVGFGLVRPLPGVWDGLVINTAITLPIGVEAYAVYALAVATDERVLTAAARRYAWASAAVALVIGMAGQVAYHLLMTANLPGAPWWVTTTVSCLPVAVLGAASVLWHLAGSAVRAATAPPHELDATTFVDRATNVGRGATTAQTPGSRRVERRPRQAPPRRRRADAGTLAELVARARQERPTAGEPAVRRLLSGSHLAASGARVRAALAEARAKDAPVHD